MTDELNPEVEEQTTEEVAPPITDGAIPPNPEEVITEPTPEKKEDYSKEPPDSLTIFAKKDWLRKQQSMK